MKIKLSKNNEVFNFSEPYIIAEIGSNHNGDMNLAKKLIDSAKACGAHAVKFQSWTPKSLIAKEEYDRNQSYDDGDGGKKHFGSLKDMVDKYYLREDQHFELFEYCKENNIDFCSTPFSIHEVNLLQKVGVPFYKVASMDINNLNLIRHIAQKQKPILLSTGMATLSEIASAVDLIESEGNDQIVILHCISIYPPNYSDIHLKNIPMFQKVFKYPVGFSDHTIGTAIPLASVALGACVIEKHFTIDKEMAGWDHSISAEPKELEEIARESKNIQKSLGNLYRTVSKDEEEKKLKFRRSIVATRDIKKGEILTIKDIDVKRPGTGIAPDESKYVIGREIAQDIGKDELLKWDNFK